MKKRALYALIVSVAISALLGIVALLAGDFGKMQAKTILTSLTVAGVSVIILACGAALDRGRGGPIVPLGIVTSILTGVLVLYGIWTETSSEDLWNVASTCVIVATFAGHTCILLNANILRHREWIRIATIACTALFGLMLIALIWIDDFEDVISWRLLATTAILGSAGTITTLVFSRIDRDAYVVPTAGGHTSQVPVCPHCGGVLPDGMKGIF